MIILYQFPGVWGLPNASTFCMKVETYLRMADIPYENSFIMDPRVAPKGKVPFIKIDGKVIADSEFIIDFLKAKFGDSLDEKLSQEEKALSVLLDQVFAERVYWLIVYMRWQEDFGWSHIKEPFFARLSKFQKLFIPNLIRKKMKKDLYVQGLGRHSTDEILHMAYKTFDAVATILDEKKYIHGDEVTSIDATVFAFLANIVWQPYEDDFKLHLMKHKNILRYCDNMWTTFYPELAKPSILIPS